MKPGERCSAGFFVLLLGFLCGGLFLPSVYARSSLPQQTDVDRAIHLVDTEGVPKLQIKDVGTYRNPAWVALYALAYAGVEFYDDTVGTKPDPIRFKACIDWLIENVSEHSVGESVWVYNFDNTYNDVVIKAPWTSAFAQATGIQALLVSYRLTGDESHLMLAERAAKALFHSVQDNGLLFQRGADVWFEEIPYPADNPSHILNGHMRVLLALNKLAEVTGKDEYRTWFKRGLDTLKRWLPRYDTSYCLRYDLNPRKQDLLFRFANPYGFPKHPVAIDRVSLRDPVSNQEISIDIGKKDDAHGNARIAGTHWGPRKELDGRTIRRLVPNETGLGQDSHSYVYLTLPGKWDDNLRSAWYELEIDYFDDARTYLTVQTRSIAPGATFRDLRDGDLMFSGAGHWRKWIVPVRGSDLGYWVGLSYAEKHASYLRQLAVHAPELERWAKIAGGYRRLGTALPEDIVIVDVASTELPKQTPMLKICSLDDDGVLMQFRASESSRFLASGMFDTASDRGTPVYSPYVVADQLINGALTQWGAFLDPKDSIARTPALHWFLEPKNQRRNADATVYDFQFDNTYNNVVTKAPWGSAFSQAYVLGAFRYAQEFMAKGASVNLLFTGVINSFDRTIEDGGVSSRDRAAGLFFEEVPNATHVLNAHLVSIAELNETSRVMPDSSAKKIADAGRVSLKNLLWKFDTGYWMKYDQNPKKEILIQIDWLDGEGSPAIDEILLENPIDGTAVRVDIGADGDFMSKRTHISGIDWLEINTIDGRTVRRFRNGYALRKEPVKGGGRHNVFFCCVLPEVAVKDFFDLLAYRLVIRYKDEKVGRFNIKIQSISQGKNLEFVPLRSGVLQTAGDGKWKEAVFTLRQQDLGWYKGAEYQGYEVEQLQRIANQTNDWFFYQYADRHRDFLTRQHKGLSMVDPWFRVATKETEKNIGGISVLRASPTYPEHDFENALDGDPDDDYVAGLGGGKEAWVDLEWHHLKSVRGVRISWENKSNFAGQVRVFRIDSNGESNDIIATFSNANGLESTVIFDEPQLLYGLRLEFDHFFGQPRLLLRQLTVLAYDPNVSLAELSDQDKQVNFLDESDERNPLKIFHLPVTANIRRLSDSLVVDVDSEYEMIVHFMNYISQFRVGVASANSPDITVAERVGACGTFSNTLLALAAAQGIQGRFVGLYNYPEDDGHVVVELFIQDAWHLYDPSYGAYYVSPQDETKQPLSFKALRKGYRTGELIESVITAPRPGRTRFVGKNIFVKAEPAGIIGPDNPMTFPLDLFYGVSEAITEPEMGAKNQGANYIGAAGVNQQQRWSLHGLVPGESYTFSITPKFLGGDLQGNEPTFKLDAEISDATPMLQLRHVFDFTKSVAEPWNIQFVADAPMVTIRLSHPYRGPEYQYIHIKRYDLKKDQR